MRAVLAACAFLAVAAVPANATIVYQTGFEAPDFVSGNLTGQGGWNQFGGGAMTVQSTVVKSGLQAARVDGSQFNGQTGPWRADPNPLPRVSVSADILITSSPDARAWQFGALGPNLARFAGGINFLANGTVRLITGGFPTVPGFTYARDSWFNVAIDLDYASQTFDLRIDGSTLASNLAFCGSNGACTGTFMPSYATMIFDTFGGLGGDAGYIDNLVIRSPVPEPATGTMLLAGLGLAALWSARRRPQPLRR